MLVHVCNVWGYVRGTCRKKNPSCIFPSSVQDCTILMQPAERQVKSIWSGENLSVINTKTLQQVMSDMFSSKLYLEYAGASLWENITGWKRIIHFTHWGCTKVCYRNGPRVCNYVDAPAFSTALNFCDFHAVGESQTLCDSQSMSQPAWGKGDR